jgi:hypothetical protein
MTFKNLIMKLFIKGIGIFILLVGLSLLIKPEFLYTWLKDSIETNYLYISAIVFRLAMGVLFLLAAKQSKYPGGIKFIGILAILAALIFFFMGSENFREFFSSLIPYFNSYAPISGLVAMLFGAFLIYAFTGNKKAEFESGI